MRIPRWRAWLAGLAVTGLAGLSVAAVSPAGALTGPPEPASFGKANLISYGNSDFESGVGNWVGYSNAVLTQGTGTTMLHNSALKDTVPAAGSTAWKLDTNELATPGANVYRAGEYLSDPVPAGDTVAFALGTYDSAGAWKGWVTSSAQTLSSNTSWQYVHGDITVPAGVAYAIGLRVTLTGAAAAQVIRTDAVTLAPLRPAMVMGARAGTSNSLANWESGNNAIGPLQEHKIFYSGALPASYPGSICDNLAQAGHSVVCVIGFKATMTQAAITAYVSGIPSTQAVVFVPHQEPENGDYTSGAAFVSYFEDQAAKIRTAAADAPNIMVMQDSSGSGYITGHPGADCSYIVPPAQGNGDGGTDFYTIDYYQEQPNGNAFPAGQQSDRWANWENCVATGSRTTAGTIPRPMGLGEFGYGVNGGPGNCVGQPESTRNSALSADGTAFQNMSDTAGAPAMFMDYWWVDDSLSEGPCRDWNFAASSSTGTTWHGFITQNGGGAN